MIVLTEIKAIRFGYCVQGSECVISYSTLLRKNFVSLYAVIQRINFEEKSVDYWCHRPRRFVFD